MSIAELDIGLERPPEHPSLQDAALFLDLDGTLAPIAERPQDVRPDPRRTSLLERLGVQLHGRLAVISGRTLDDIDHILEGRVTAVAAVHGLVRRDVGGQVSQAMPHPALTRAMRAVRSFAEHNDGVLIEDKALSIAVHYRLAPEQGRAARELAAEIAAATGLAVQPGDMVVELKTPGASKGDSVRAFMAEPPFAGACPIFLGDDLTDEAGFRAVSALGGYGVLVGPGRPTAARFGMANVDAALAWLEAAL